MSKKIGASSKEDAVNGSVMTVLGPIDADDMGVTLVHEHLIWDVRSLLHDHSLTGCVPSELKGRVDLENLGVLHRNPFYLEDNLVLDDVTTIESELLAFKEAGGRTMVELTPLECGRSPSKLVQIAQLTGVNIVMSCGHECPYEGAYDRLAKRIGRVHELMKDRGLDPKRLRLCAVCTVCSQAFLREVQQMGDYLSN